MIVTQAMKMRIYHDPRFPPSPYYRFFDRLAAFLHPRLSVELGVCGGGASLHLCKGWPGGIVVGIDLANDYPDNLFHIIDNYPNFRFIIGDSVEKAPAIYKDYGEIDILFIDTTHTYEQTMKEYRAYRPYLSHQAIVCLDDLNRPGMDQAWNEMPGRKVRFDILHPGQTEGGFGVVYGE